MKKISYLTLFVLSMLLLAACGNNGEAPAPVEVTRVVVVTATAEAPVATETPAPTSTPRPRPTATPAPTATSLPEPTTVPTPVPTATVTPVPVDPAVLALIETLPAGLNQLFGEDSRDLGLVTAPANENFASPLDPHALYPIDEDGGVLGLATGYPGITIGKINDGGKVYRLAGPWGGPTAEANYTYMVFAVRHSTDVGAYQVGLDHYPAGSVAVSSGHPTEVQLAENMLLAVGHTSGNNDTVTPAPRVGIFIVNSETGAVSYFEATYEDGEWSWAPAQTGKLPLVGEWNPDSTVFDVLD